MPSIKATLLLAGALTPVGTKYEDDRANRIWLAIIDNVRVNSVATQYIRRQLMVNPAHCLLLSCVDFYLFLNIYGSYLVNRPDFLGLLIIICAKSNYFTETKLSNL